MTEDASWLCPVWGMDTPSQPVRIFGIQDPPRPAVEFILVGVSDDERAWLQGGAMHLPVSSMQIHDARAAIRTNAAAVFGSEPIRTAGLRVCSLALAIWCPEITIPFCFLTRGGPAEYGGIQSTGNDPFLPSGMLRRDKLDQNALQLLPVVASSIAANVHRVTGAAMRFYWAGHKPFYLDAILDYAIAAESLICRGVGDNFGATFRRRAARLLSRDRDEAATAKRATVIYNLRSKIVHGDDDALDRALEPWSGDQALARRDVRSFTRDVLLALLADPSLLTANGLARLDEPATHGGT